MNRAGSDTPICNVATAAVKTFASRSMTMQSPQYLRPDQCSPQKLVRLVGICIPLRSAAKIQFELQL